MQYETDKSRLIHFKADGFVEFSSVALAPRLTDSLRSNLGIKILFDMQAKVISHLLSITEKGQVGDIVLCAPTGSGKTLAYALPILQCLLDRTIPKLRALVVVPTRDLAMQVKKVFVDLTRSLGISTVVISGTATVSAESEHLLNAEIVIATPGRLVDHIENNEHFSLHSVKFLVLDESDRLLEDSYQGWIDVLMPVLGTQKNSKETEATGNQGSRNRPTSGILALAINPEVSARSFVHFAESSEESVRKILVSATQTRNPKRLVRLGLRQPTIFEPRMSGATDPDDSESKFFSVPSSMSENGWVVHHLQDKPMGLLKLLGWGNGMNMSEPKRAKLDCVLPKGGVKLIFTKSVEAAHRLCRLLELFSYVLKQKVMVLEMSGELTPRRRQFVLNAVKNAMNSSGTKTDEHDDPKSFIVVCSDVLARGMDILNVDAVVNYDAPVHIRTYLHRAGRTARAGRLGTVTTLLLPKQVYHFRTMVKLADRGSKKVLVNSLSVVDEDKSNMFSLVSAALFSLKRILARENMGLLDPGDAVPKYALHELGRRICGAPAPFPDEHLSDDDSTLDDSQSRNLSHKRPGKRRKSMVAGPDGQISSLKPENGKSAGEDEDDAGDDNFSDLLFAQLSRNFLSSSH